MKKTLLGGMTALALLSSSAYGQTQPVMDPAVVEKQAAASSSAGLVVPLFLLLVLLVAVSSNPASAPIRG